MSPPLVDGGAVILAAAALPFLWVAEKAGNAWNWMIGAQNRKEKQTIEKYKSNKN